MSVVFTHLFVKPARTWSITSDGNVYVFDSLSGLQLHSSQDIDEPTRARISKAGAIVSADVESEGRWLVTAGNDKCVRVWGLESVHERESLKVLSERDAPKKPTCLRLTKDGQTIVVSDKFGDVHTFPLTSSPEPSAMSSAEPTKKRVPARSHASLLLGHVSHLTHFLLTPDEKHIITADRDEHVRVSWFPKAYVVERMCLGHRSFVSALHIPPFSPTHLVSAGGDPELKMWDWASGRVITEVHIENSVRPYIKVSRKRFGKGDEEGGEGEDEGGGGKAKGSASGKKLNSRQRRRANQKARRAAEEGGGVEQEDEDGENDDTARSVAESNAMAVDPVAPEPQNISSNITIPAEAADGACDALSTSSLTEKDAATHPEPLLAVHKIDSINTRSHGQWFVFSAIGATALFAFPYPQCLLSSSSSSSTATSEPSNPSSTSTPIVHIDLGKPILDFVCVSDPSGGGVDEVWVLLDSRWAEGLSYGEREHSNESVQVVTILEGALKRDGTSSMYPWVHKSLNALSLQPGSTPTSDLYALLAILPKPTHIAHTVPQSQSPFPQGTHHDAASIAHTRADLNVNGVARPLSLKEKGRLKSKLAVMKKKAEVEGVGIQEMEPEVKKAKTSENGEADGS